MTAVKEETRPILKVILDGREFEAREGETVLDLARRQGVDIPALCHEAGTAGWGACRLCLVEIDGSGKLQAACTTPVAAGMIVTTDSPRIRAKRQSYLRMFLSDHNAYCEAPCSHMCPAHLDIPAFMGALGEGDFGRASDILARDLPFAGILGRVCQGDCEPVCRRGDADEAVSICALHRVVADVTSPVLPAAEPSGKRVAVVGAGLAGLSAAWFLTASGHQVTLYDASESPGGYLRDGDGASETGVPGHVFDREFQPLWEAGVRFIGGSKYGCGQDPGDLLDAGFDALIVAAESAPSGDRPRRSGDRGPQSAHSPQTVNPVTGRSSRPGLFSTERVATTSGTPVHNVADGKRVALAVDACLRGDSLDDLEAQLAAYAELPYMEQLAAAADLGPLGRRLAERNPVWLKMGVRAEPASRVTESELPLAGGSVLDAIATEAARCLQCTCSSLGKCELQRLGVEYAITENKLATRTSRVREVQPQYEHPFIRRDMSRCVSCGRCVSVCRDVAGPACYDFTGRGFTINVDTPYADALQLTGCTSCGRCVLSCPTGALSFNERTVTSFKVDEGRCIACGECVEICPASALAKTERFEELRHDWHELMERGSGLVGGHRMCAGCGAPVVVRQVLMGTTDPVVVSSATGCLEVSTTIYPYTSWKSSFIHTAFENSAATLSGVETAFRALKKKGAIDDNVKFIAFGGDGGTYDIGLQSLSGAMERGHRMLYVCYDNGAYMNTGFQRSGATPVASWTTTSPVGEEIAGKLQHRKNLTDIMVAHDLAYVAQASPHDPRDLISKATKALATDGPTFLNVLSPCPRGWRAEGADTIDLAREAVNTCYWPLFEVENGVYRLSYRPQRKAPLREWLRRQGRFAHLFKPAGEEALAQLEEWVEREWQKLLVKCGEPSEAEWDARFTT